MIEDGSFRLQITTPLKTISFERIIQRDSNIYQNDVDIDSTTYCITTMQIEF